jgi:hypothetical protein
MCHERHLRQVLNFLIDRGRVLPTNTDLPFWLSRADLAAADVLPRKVLDGDEPVLLLVTDPDDRMLLDRPEPEQLRVYWRVLFRAAIMAAIDAKVAAGGLTAEQCRERLSRYGPAVAREIRFVLEAEHLLAAEAGDVDAYRTFAAVYLDLSYFTAQAAEEFFPALPHGHAVRDALRHDVDADALFPKSRPQGSADPEREPTPDERWAAPVAPAADPGTAAPAGDASNLLRRATAAEQKGNAVRAAILRNQAAAALQGADRDRAAEAAAGSVRVLVDRLGDLLKWDPDTREEWRQALRPLLPAAARGIWPRAARCLYELQRLPADFAREVYAVDLPEYIRTFGRRPLRRELPHARPVMMLMAFRKAHAQLLRAGLSEHEQLRLDRLMHHEIRRQEHAIRHEFTPIVERELTAAGLVPGSRAEAVSRDKLVAELLDRVCERGYLRIGNLRDAVARNQLKLPDLAGPGEFVGGDPLLRADTKLAYALDGVYRRGEFYLRWIQRVVSVFFGTPWGRLLTLYLLLPFGGAFLALMFAEEMRHLGGKVAAFVSKSIGRPVPARAVAPPVAPVKPASGITPAPTPLPVAPAPQPAGEWKFDEDTLEFYFEEPPPVAKPNTLDRIFEHQKEGAELVVGVFVPASTPPPPEEHDASFLIEWPTVLGFGVFLMLMFHVPPFRRAVLWVLGGVWRLVRGAAWDVPARLWRSPALRAVRLSAAVRMLHRHVATPLGLSLILVGVLFIFGFPLEFLLRWGWLSFLLLLAAYNTGPGWAFQDRLAEQLSDWWRVVRVNLLPGLLGWIIDGFRWLANWFERQLYAVDEWMRFRGGDSQGSLFTKAVLGLVWFPVAYVARFAFYLLIEPQVNPIKHFPVVTVSHKVMLPTVVTSHPTVPSAFGAVLVQQLGMAVKSANFWAFWFVAAIPGIFGFIAWELKENWKLYAANRSRRLTPATVGSHGESVRGLLRPGFHSGTVPRLHRQSRKALAKGDGAKLVHLHHELEHVAEGVHRFAERELVPLLAGAPEWGGLKVEVGAVEFGVQRATIALFAHSLGREPFSLALENVGGVIEASVARVGWADKLTDAQRAVFVFALRGLLDMAAAARYDGTERSHDAPDAPGFAALVRCVTWDEWVAFWKC